MGNLDPLRARLLWGAQLSDTNPVVKALTPADLRNLRLPWLSRFSSDTLDTHLRANPGKAFWVPKTGEYIVAERWRRRDDIGNIVEVTARKGKTALIQAILERLRDCGCRLAMLSEDVWNDQSRLYADLGFSHREKIVFFHKDLKSTGTLGVLSLLPLLDYSIAQAADLDLLMQLDNNSFPWLWWNSREDMANYMLTDAVSVYIARAEGEPVGYASFTLYNGWAHLDRLAVIEAQQGRKYGAAQLSHVMRVMLSLGAAYVGLSTQENNTRSHRLYRGFGFNQTRDSVNLYALSLE